MIPIKDKPNSQVIQPRKSLFREIPMRDIIRDRHTLHQIVPKELSAEFKPIKILGKGDSGIVIEAETRRKKKVAIKCVLNKPGFKDRELQILKTNDSPLLLSLITSFVTNITQKHLSYINYVTELMPMTLRQFVNSYQTKNEPMPPIYKKLFAFQLFAGLTSLHKRGIIHRDINMDNILIDPQVGKLKIADFGCSKYYVASEENVTYITERPYRAPELIYGCKHYGPSVDIWAAGCIYAELLKGQPLFAGSSQINILHNIVKILGPPQQRVIDAYNAPEPVLIPMAATTSIGREIPNCTNDEVNFFTKVFNFDPKGRPSGQRCMEAHCFDELFNGIASLPNHTPLPVLDRGGYSHLKKFDFNS